MVPAFNNEGELPGGEHVCSMEEFKERFVYNGIREIIFGGLLKLTKDLIAIQCTMIYIGGSFVTDKNEPNDIDVCWEDNDGIDWGLLDSDFQIFFDLDPPRSWQHNEYFADVFPANIMEGSSGKLFKDFFKSNTETDNPKGVIKMRI